MLYAFPRGSWEREIISIQIHLAFFSYHNQKDILYKLLWGSLAKDMYIFPRLYFDVYIYDLKKGIIVQPYDDRGMDIIGTNHTYMQNLYHKFSKYLFDYDMKKMLNVFE